MSWWFKPIYYRWYVDETFVLFCLPDHYLNFEHRNIRFTFEKENNNSIPFIDVLITRTSNGFKTFGYGKPTFSGLYSNFNSFIYKKYNVGVIVTLLFRMFSIVLNFSRSQSEVCYLKRYSKRTHFLWNW